MVSKVSIRHNRKGKKSKVVGSKHSSQPKKVSHQSVKFITGEDDEVDYLQFTKNSLDRFIMESMKDNLSASLNDKNEIELYWGLEKIK